MILKPEVSIGDIISAVSFLVAASALFLTLWQLRRDAVHRKAEFAALALQAQLNALIQILAMPEAIRNSAWKAIASAPGGPGDNFPIEEAIAMQVSYFDLIAQGTEISTIPTYKWVRTEKSKPRI